MAAARGAPVQGVRSILNRVVVIAALGYFVDIYDLILFAIVRRASLLDLGVAEAELFEVGAMLISWQMGGLLIGGILWGMLGDKRGRLTVLFGSILLYSLANLANGFVGLVPREQVIPVYAALRFIAGVGLAGELGAAITLVSEVMTKEARGYGAAVVAGVGILGGLFAYGVSEVLTWQAAYVVGGALGLLLLAARFAMRDSGMFESLRRSNVRRGDFLVLFASRKRFSRYAYTLLVGLPIWFVVGVLITFSPEFAPLIGVTGPVSAGAAVAFTYLGLSIGDVASGVLSGVLRSRRWVFVGFLGFTSLLIFAYTLGPSMTPAMFYLLAFLLGLGIGYWAVFNINAAEQFGTNLRATVATTAPNFVRGALVPILFVFQALAAPLGLVPAAIIVGQGTVLIALFAVWRLKETYGADLDYVEEVVVPETSAVGMPRPVGGRV
jgi:MFS transporter, putative metabolite:H+ symporter